MTPASTHELAARAVVRLAPTASPAEHREVMEALGIIAPGSHELTPDPPTLSVSSWAADSQLSHKGKKPLNSEVRQPTARPENSTSPPGLRNLAAPTTPSTTAPVKTTTPARRGRPPKVQVDTPAAPTGRKPKPINHGTSEGYAMHHRRGIPTCDPCRLAGNEARKANKRKAQAASDALAERTPPEQVVAALDVLDEWIGTTRTSRNPDVQAAALTVAASSVRLRLTVDELDRACRRSHFQHPQSA